MRGTLNWIAQGMTEDFKHLYCFNYCTLLNVCLYPNHSKALSYQELR